MAPQSLAGPCTRNGASPSQLPICMPSLAAKETSKMDPSRKITKGLASEGAQGWLGLDLLPLLAINHAKHATVGIISILAFHEVGFLSEDAVTKKCSQRSSHGSLLSPQSSTGISVKRCFIFK